MSAPNSPTNETDEQMFLRARAHMEQWSLTAPSRPMQQPQAAVAAPECVVVPLRDLIWKLWAALFAVAVIWFWKNAHTHAGPQHHLGP